MTNFFRKRKLRAFFVAVFLVVLLLNGNQSFAANKVTYTTVAGFPVSGTIDPVSVTLDSTHKYQIIGGTIRQGSADQQDKIRDLNTGIEYYASASEIGILNAAGGFQGNGLLGGINQRSAQMIVDNATANGECAVNHPINCMMQMLYYLLFGIAWVVSWITYVFDIVFRLTVVEMSQRIKDITIINTGWTAVRDLANISFIFILLYLAIATILQLDEHGVKHSLSRLIIAAVLINFSLFFTKVIIDVPNILSIQIYNKITSNQPENAVGPGGLGSAFFKILKPETVVPAGAELGVDRAGTTSLNQKAAQAFARNGTFPTFIMMIILYFFILVVFLAAAIIFIKRFVMLLFYMIFSPLAFAGMAIPIHSLQSAAKDQFWSGLIKESFYAPIFLMCAYLALVTGTSLSSVAIDTTSNTFSGTVFGFVVVIVMLVASLIIAESMGVKGAGGAMGFYKSMSGAGLNVVKWVGSNTITRGSTAILRGTVGKWSYNALEGKSHGTHAFVQWMTQARSGNLGAWQKLKANVATSVLHAGANIKAGETGESFMEAKESKKAGMKAYEYEVKDDPARIAEYYHEMSRRGENDLNTRVAVEQEWEDKDPKHQAEILARLRYERARASSGAVRAQQAGNAAEETRLTARANSLQATLDHLYTRRLSAAEKDEVDRASEKPLEFHRERFDEMADPVVASQHAHHEAEQAHEAAVRGFGAQSHQAQQAAAEVTRTQNVIQAVTTARQAHEAAVAAHDATVQTHGANSAQAQATQQAVTVAETNIRNAAAPIINEASVRDYYSTLNVNQKVGLRPEQFSMSMLGPVRDGHELEQIQRKSNITPEQREQISNSITAQLQDFITRTQQHGIASISAAERANIESTVKYMGRNGHTWFAGRNNANVTLSTQVGNILSAAPQPQQRPPNPLGNAGPVPPMPPRPNPLGGAGGPGPTPPPQGGPNPNNAPRPNNPFNPGP